MFQKYREILFGIAFGLGAAVIDTFIDARQGGISPGAELAQHPIMLLYRLLFVVFGLILGWLLWQRSRREREYRQLSETLDRLRQECGKHSLLMHARLQLILTRSDLQLSREAEELIRNVYQTSQDLQTVIR